jgi:hypothetical protein
MGNKKDISDILLELEGYIKENKPKVPLQSKLQSWRKSSTLFWAILG